MLVEHPMSKLFESFKKKNFCKIFLPLFFPLCKQTHVQKDLKNLIIKLYIKDLIIDLLHKYLMC